MLFIPDKNPGKTLASKCPYQPLDVLRAAVYAAYGAGTLRSAPPATTGRVAVEELAPRPHKVGAGICAHILLVIPSRRVRLSSVPAYPGRGVHRPENDAMVRFAAVLGGMLGLLAALPASFQLGLTATQEKENADQMAVWAKVWTSPTLEASIRSLGSAVDTERMSRHLFHLARDPLPYRKLNFTLPGHAKNTLYEADDYLTEKLASWGYRVQREGVQVQAFRRDTSKPLQAQYSRPMPDDPWYTAYNLYAERKGRSRPDEVILLLAHKDSQSWIDSPGANDNAIGTVGVLELACVLANHTPECTIRFLFCNEEHTPWTSISAAQNARKRGDKIVAVFNLDGLGGKTAAESDRGAQTNVTAYTEAAGRQLAELMSAVNTRFAIGLDQRIVRRESPGDDDGSFVKSGYSAAVINIGSWPYGDPNYHSEGDIPERSDVPNAAKVVQATLAAILTIDQGRAIE